MIKEHKPIFEKNFASLHEDFYAPVDCRNWPSATLLYLDKDLCKDLALGQCSELEITQLLSATLFSPFSKPVAMAYAGHQFGNFVPSLGDGRAMLLGELRDKQGLLWDVHLKGSGRTAFSRGGDGLSPLGPVLRECLVSFANYHLGISTSRPLAAIATGSMVIREQALPGAILARVARSHVRVGTYEYFACRGQTERLLELHEFVCRRLYPNNPEFVTDYFYFFKEVSFQLAKTFAKWMAFGFVHGVLNTDNTFISGETLDYGPCAFIDDYHSMAVFSSIDRHGRYAYGNQPTLLRWNLARLADCLLIFYKEEERTAAKLFEQYLNEELPQIFSDLHHQFFCEKLGLVSDSALHAVTLEQHNYPKPPSQRQENQASLITQFLSLLEKHKLDFTLSFRSLCDSEAEELLYNWVSQTKGLSSLDNNEWKQDFQQFKKVLAQTQNTINAQEIMQNANPIVVARNHLVEKAIAAANHGDYGLFEQMRERLKKPFTRMAANDLFELPPSPEEKVTVTFCGT